ncbi:MAG: hypothetical protein ABIW34_00090 [Ginsengibacter sp.]
MKIYLNVILIMVILSCNNTQEKKALKDSADSTAKNIVHKKSMKGFDLYAWEKAGKMFFTLLPGTNRKKMPEDIYDIKNAVEGESAIENKINEIAAGEYIFLKPIHIDTSDLKPLIEFMKRKNLNVTIIPEK